MDKIKDLLTRGVDEVIVKESLEKKLASGKKLTVKLGIDPTGSLLHLGHSVVLRKLRQFQDLGHNAILIIGDFTAKIGDPSGRTKERKSITDTEITKNMETYIAQASKILDMDKITFAKNSSWFEKMGLLGVLELASKASVAQLLERKEFKERLKNSIDIPYLEMLYPLMQGYDSVQLKADVELGGSDQKFNLLMGRQIQRKYEQDEQDIITTKLLVGTDGAKMSKSADNFIPLNLDPNDMYGKVMAISDDLIDEYWELCTDLPLEEIANKYDPYVTKKKLATEIVRIYHGTKASQTAGENFKNVFSNKNYNENLIITQTIEPGEYKQSEILTISGATTSTVQAKELIRAGTVSIDNIPLSFENWQEKVKLTSGQIIRVGKKRLIKVK